jgi:uncharacterized coiled-coil protein SlyX
MTPPNPLPPKFFTGKKFLRQLFTHVLDLDSHVHGVGDCQTQLHRRVAELELIVAHQRNQISSLQSECFTALHRLKRRPTLFERFTAWRKS